MLILNLSLCLVKIEPKIEGEIKKESIKAESEDKVFINKPAEVTSSIGK